MECSNCGCNIPYIGMYSHVRFCLNCFFDTEENKEMLDKKQFEHYCKKYLNQE